jgi:hypothetical protein
MITTPSSVIQVPYVKLNFPKAPTAPPLEINEDPFVNLQPPPTPISMPISVPIGPTTFPGPSNTQNFLLHIGYDRICADYYLQRPNEELDLIMRNAIFFGLQVRYHR